MATRMRWPQIFRRSAPTSGRKRKGSANDRVATLRVLAAQLAVMTEKADSTGEIGLGDLLGAAMVEAESLLRQIVAHDQN